MFKKSFVVLVLAGALALSPLAVMANRDSADNGSVRHQMGDVVEFDVPGLDGDVTIRYDEMGIPHIYATTTHDLIMAQGFVHAADRWWQMEWFRHQGSGRLSELAGSSLVGTDTFLRTLGLHRNAQTDLDSLPEDVLALLETYAAGVNAWLADKPPSDVALEYDFVNQLRAGFGADPITSIEPWTPLNSATWLQVMALGLNGNMNNELLRLNVLAQAGPDMLPVVAPGYDYEHQPLIMEPGWQPVKEISRDLGDVPFLASWPGLENVAALRDAGAGSNNWVVGGELTESGMPLLANDPHLGIQMPSIWYEVGLHCVEISEDCPYDVSGYSFAGTPFVIIGHNQQIGWGVTNVGTDVQDLYLLEINPDNPLQYRYEGEWVDMDIITETITPWDGDPVEVPVRMTRFGPVVNELFDIEQPMALRWGAADANRNFQSFTLLNKASNWDEFQEAVSYFDLAAQNFIYADMDGNIGYITSGRIPIRAEGHDGSLPVDGTTGEFEWQGYVDPMDNPRLFNPATHYIVTANNAVLAPDEFPYTITVDWAFGYRAARIETLLQSYDVYSLDTFAAIQFDNFNTAASLIVPVLAETDLGDDRLTEAAAWLAEWDYQNDADSPQAALFNAFWREFVPLVFDELPAYDESFNIHRLAPMLGNDEHPLWNNAELGISDPGEFMRTALENGLSFMEGEYGADRAAWRWGDLHVARFKAAPLGQLPYGLDPELDQYLPLIFALFNRETGASGGSAIVNATSWSITSGNFDVTSVPSMRMILDFSDLENSRFIHTTGQSGAPLSPHYDDMVSLWANGEYHAHHFSAEAVEASTTTIWTLKPAE